MKSLCKGWQLKWSSLVSSNVTGIRTLMDERSLITYLQVTSKRQNWNENYVNMCFTVKQMFWVICDFSVRCVYITLFQYFSWSVMIFWGHLKDSAVTIRFCNRFNYIYMLRSSQNSINKPNIMQTKNLYINFLFN